MYDKMKEKVAKATIKCVDLEALPKYKVYDV